MGKKRLKSGFIIDYWKKLINFFPKMLQNVILTKIGKFQPFVQLFDYWGLVIDRQIISETNHTLKFNSNIKNNIEYFQFIFRPIKSPMLTSHSEDLHF